MWLCLYMLFDCFMFDSGVLAVGGRVVVLSCLVLIGFCLGCVVVLLIHVASYDWMVLPLDLGGCSAFCGVVCVVLSAGGVFDDLTAC